MRCWVAGRCPAETQSLPPSRGSKARQAELMQNRAPVGSGPSGNTWPRWAPHEVHRVSVRTIPWLSSPWVSTTPVATGFWKLGQPLRESYLVSLSKRVAPQTTQQYAPDRFSSR